MKTLYPVINFLLSLGFLVSSALKAEVPRQSFYYLRCNSTSWDISPENSYELLPQATSDRLELIVDIRNPAILRDGDDCALTRTSVKGQWGVEHEHLRMMQSRVDVPAASWIYPNQSADEPHFRVRYPAMGRYRFRYFVRDSLLVITPESPTARAGELAWALPGRLFQGSGASLFRQSDGWNADTQKSQSLLALLNPQTGEDLWQFSMKDAYISPSSECSQKDLIVASSDRDILAFERKTGQILWRNPINHGINAPYPILSINCPKVGDLIYVSYGTLEDPRFSVLDGRDGHKLWTIRGQQLLYTPHLNGETLVLYRDQIDFSQPQASKRIFTAVQVATGKNLWTRSESSFSALYQDLDGRIYITGPDSWQRLQDGQAKTQWRFDTDGHWISPVFDKSGLYALDGHILRKIDPASGEILWSYQGETQQYLSTIYLSQGKILVREGAKLSLLDAVSGNRMWLRTFPNSYVPPTVSTDKQERIYVAGSGWMKRLDPNTGRDVWSQEHSGFPDDGQWVLQSVADSDQETLYALFSGPGYRCPPSTVHALDAQTGRSRWRRQHDGPLWLAASDREHLYLAEGCQGPLVFKSIRK